LRQRQSLESLNIKIKGQKGQLKHLYKIIYAKNEWGPNKKIV